VENRHGSHVQSLNTPALNFSTASVVIFDDSVAVRVALRSGRTRHVRAAPGQRACRAHSSTYFKYRSNQSKNVLCQRIPFCADSTQ
jgi:hypothetical protein